MVYMFLVLKYGYYGQKFKDTKDTQIDFIIHLLRINMLKMFLINRLVKNMRTVFDTIDHSTGIRNISDKCEINIIAGIKIQKIISF